MENLTEINKAIQKAFKKKTGKTPLGKKLQIKDIEASILIGNLVQVNNADLGSFICSTGNLAGELKVYKDLQEPLSRWYRFAQMHPATWNEALAILRDQVARQDSKKTLDAILKQINETDLMDDESISAAVQDAAKIATRNIK